jgi:hypothetical protein
MVTETRFLPNSPTQNQLPDSRLVPHADSVRLHHRHYHSLICISCYQSCHHQNLISVYCVFHKQLTCTVMSDMVILWVQLICGSGVRILCVIFYYQSVICARVCGKQLEYRQIAVLVSALWNWFVCKSVFSTTIFWKKKELSCYIEWWKQKWSGKWQ